MIEKHVCLFTILPGGPWGALKCCTGAQSHMGINYSLGYWHSLWIWFRG